MIHASIDSLEEAMTAHHQGGRRSGGDASKWIGLLCPMEESYVYGKLNKRCVETTSKVRI